MRGPAMEWRRLPMQFLPQSFSRFEAGRKAEVLLVAELAGGRTVLRRQHVGYPFHVTRAFQLDRMRPDLATLYLQSASGGLYAADRLALDLVVGATLIMAEGFAAHDPHGRGGTFTRFSTHTRIMAPEGRLLVSDRGSVRGEELSANCGTLGGMTAAGSVLMITAPDRLADIAEIEAAADACGCLAGVTAAPNQAGLAMRFLAPDGGTLIRGIEAAFHLAARAALGVDLAPRRK